MTMGRSAVEQDALPIAVVGIAAQLPSGSSSGDDLDYHDFLEFLLQRRDAYERIPGAYFNADMIRGSAVGQVVTDAGAFLKHRDYFDHVEFGIPAKEARMMSLGVRKLIETAFLALCDSGVDYRGQNVGCYMSGVAHDMFAISGHDDTEAVGAFSNAPSMLANRISYYLNLRGPSVAVDTACSSSLYATHLAVQALRMGDCDAALVGGCQINHRFTEWLTYSRGGILSADGKCKPFDASADGFGRGEGVITIILKPLDDALRDNDHVYGVILGTGVNASGSLVPANAPAAVAQIDAMRRAYRQAQRNPKDVDFVELHATGTAAGDPAEANWVGEEFVRDDELLIGSVKGNTGHLEVAAFLASLCKVCGILDKRLIIPNVNLQRPNPAIQWNKYRLRVPLEPEPLGCRSAGGRSLISIASSGIGGANGHCVVEAAPPHPSSKSAMFWAAGAERPTLLLAGGLTPRSTEAVGNSIPDTFLSSVCPSDAAALARHLARRARSMTWRSSAVIGTGSRACFTPPTLVPKAPPTLVFVFSGQGGQHLHMGRELFASCLPFRESVLSLDAAYKAAVGNSLIETTRLFADTPTGSAHGLPGDIWPISITLPALAIFQLALVDTLAALGIRPDVVVGHSAGETALLAVSGSASKIAAIELAIARGRALSLVEGDNGAMAAFGCSPETAQELIDSVVAELGPGVLEIGCYNSPSAVTLSGAASHVHRAVHKASGAGIFARPLRTRVPVHSGMLACSRPTYDDLVGDVFARHSVTAPKVATYSSKSGGVLEGAFDAQYFWESTIGPVRFTESIQAISNAYPTSTFLEIGPHPALVSYIASMTNTHNLVACPVRRPKRGESNVEVPELLSVLGKTFAAGHGSLDLDALYGTTATFKGKLPKYPFSPKAIPWSIPTPEIIRQRQHRNGPLNYTQLHVNVQTHPGLADHVIKGEPIMPAAGYIEMALEFGATALYDIEFHSLLSLSSERPIPVDVKLEGCRWSVSSAIPGDFAKSWPMKYERLHASGLLSKRHLGDSTLPAIDLESIRKRMHTLSGTDFYSTLPQFAQYGPMYRRIVQCHYATGSGGAVEALTELRACRDDIPNLSDYRFHPAILDAAIHILVHPCLTGNYDEDLYHLPSKIGALRLCPAFLAGGLPRTIFAHASFVEWSPDTLTYNFTITDEIGAPLCFIDRLQVALHGFRLKAVHKRYDVVYHPAELSVSLPPGTLMEAHPDRTCISPASSRDCCGGDHPNTRPFLLFPSPINIANSTNGFAVPATSILYARGEEIQIQEIILSFDHLSPLSILFVAYESESRDDGAILGFTRSLRKEYPLWTIRAAIFEVSLATTQLAAAAERILRLTEEPELRVLADGSIHVPRIEPLDPPARTEPFTRGRPWKLENKAIVQTYVPKASDASHIVVEVTAVSTASGGSWTFIGRAVDETPAAPRVGIVCGPLSSHLVIHRGATVQLDDLDIFSRLESDQYLGPSLLAPTIVALTVGSRAFADTQRISGLHALIVESDSTLGPQLCSACTQLGLDTSLVTSIDDVDPSSVGCRPTFVISSVSDIHTIEYLRSIVSPKGRIFLWNHPDEGIPFLNLHDPWAIGDALREVLAVRHSLEQTRYVPPLETMDHLPSHALRSPLLFDPHRAYILLGGIGSLGLHISLWMYQNGARHLVLTSRSGVRSLDSRGDFISQRILRYLQERSDLVLKTVAADATSEDDMRSLLRDVERPLGGCMLLSAVLSDRLFASHTQDSFEVSFPPKVDVLRTLEKTIDLDGLDFLIAFSSVAGMFGNPGQTSYAAANTALAGLTRKYRNALSLVAPIIRDSRILVLSDSSYVSRVRHMTSWGMSARELCDYIGDGIMKLRDGPVWQYIPDFDWAAVQANMGPSKLYDHLVQSDAQEPVDAQTDEPSSVAQIVCRVLDIHADDFSADVPLTAYGLDSLTAASLSFALRPFLAISQIQLLADITTKDIQAKLDAAREDSAKDDAIPPRAKAVEAISDRLSERTREMEELLVELSAGMVPADKEIPTEASHSEQRTGTIIVTGTTGSLGAHVLARLLCDTGDGMVIALLRTRKDGPSPMERQMDAFASRGLDVSLLQSDRLRVISGNLQEANLGLPQTLCEEIRASLTHIVHLGWPINFQAPLASCKDALLGVRHLIDFASSARDSGSMKILYGSSSGIFGNYKQPVPPRELPLPAEVAAGQGYNESKWVAERLLGIAAERKMVRAVIVRIGQLSGGVNGAWKSTEWFPALVSASVALRCLPRGEGVVSWMPASAAANVIVDMLRLPRDPYTILHLRHPNPLPWMTIMEHLALALKIPIIPYAEWFRMLSAASARALDPQATKLLSTALALLDHFRSVEAIPALATDPARENNGLSVLMDVEESCKRSPALRAASAQQLSVGEVEKWVAYWKKVGCIP